MKRRNNKDYVENIHGLRERKCCASCKHRAFVVNRRVCSLHDIVDIKPGDVCDDWELRPAVRSEGHGKGGVLSLEYLMFWRKEKMADDKKPSSEIMREFRDAYHISPYVIEPDDCE